MLEKEGEKEGEEVRDTDRSNIKKQNHRLRKRTYGHHRERMGGRDR